MHSNSSLALALAALMLPALAFAEKKPTVVIVHKVHEGTNWQEVARDLTQDGYTVVSAGMSDAYPAQALKKDLQNALAGERGRRILLIGTESGSEIVNSFASTQTKNVVGLVYLSSRGAPPLAAAVSQIPACVLRLVPGERFRVEHESGFTTYTVPVSHSVAKPVDVAYTIDRMVRQLARPAVSSASSPSTIYVASLH